MAERAVNPLWQHSHFNGYLNYQMSETYRRYNDFVSDYLREHPHQVIIHFLERKSSRKKYSEDDILTKDVTTGKITLQGSGKLYTIDFSVLVTLHVLALIGYNGTFSASPFMTFSVW